MTHKEFKLIVKTEIRERSGRGVEYQPVIYKPGDVMIVDEDTFLDIQAGESQYRQTREGSIQFDKYSFENEVANTEITVEYGVRKLGQRKNKVA